MIPALLAQIGLPLLLKAVGAGLARVDNPVAAAASKALAEVDSAIEGHRIDPETIALAHAHALKVLELELVHDGQVLAEINRTIRVEAISGDAYVRRMRPTFGYIMALTWAAQMRAVARVIATNPAEAAAVIAGLASLGTIWTVGLSVLGIYVYKRSREKELAQGAESAGVASALAGLVGRIGTR